MKALAVAAALIAAGATTGAAAADRVHGEEVYARCMACHALRTDRVGPHHCGLFGRKAGGVPGFAYSAAKQRSNIVWDEATLSRLLAKPQAVVPGTSMTYDGVPDAKDRADLVAYLKRANGSPNCRR